MTDYEKLRKEFDEKVKQLQEKCLHKKSSWVAQCWAVGHYTGNSVLVCNNCNKILKAKKAKWEVVK